MDVRNRRALLRQTADIAAEFLERLPERPVWPPVDLAALRATLGGPMPERGDDPQGLIEALARDAEPGIVGTAGPRYFGFVVGGGVPAALAADWLTSAWDQNAGLYALSPAASVVEEVAATWLVDLFGLPAGSSVGFVTGATMANFTAIAAARHRVLETAGWNHEEDGLIGAPPIAVVVGDEAHVTIFVSLQMLGLGRARVHRVAADEQGRMRPDALRETLARLDGPTIVCAQAGNVNTGAFDPLPEIVAAVRDRPNAWLHVDGAFGLWAAAAPGLRDRVAGLDGADSWTTDAHKWLNVPYDSGIVDRPRRGRAPRGDDAGRGVLRRDRRRRARPVQLGAGVVAPRPRVRGLRRAPIPRTDGPRRPPRAVLLARPPDGRWTARRGGRHDPQRRRPQPGPRPVRAAGGRGRGGDRRLHPGSHRRRPGRRDVLARRHDVARHGRDADLGLELEHDRSRRRPVRRGDPAVRADRRPNRCARLRREDP